MEERWGSRGQDFWNRHGHSPFAMCWDGVLPPFKSARSNASPNARLWKSRIWLYIGNMWQVTPLIGYQSNISSTSKSCCLYSLLRTWQRCPSSLWAFPSTHNLSPIIRKTSDKSQSRHILQNTWANCQGHQKAVRVWETATAKSSIWRHDK